MQWLREQAQMHRWRTILGQACCQHGAAQQDKADAQQELLLLEEICIYKRVKNRCKIHSKKKGHDELGWSARQGAFSPPRGAVRHCLLTATDSWALGWGHRAPQFQNTQHKQDKEAQP